MTFAIIIILAGLFLYLFISKKSSYYLIFSLYMLSLSAITISSFMYMAKSTAFQLSIQLDFYIYEWLAGLKLPIPLLSRIYTASVALFMLASLLIIKKLKQPGATLSFFMFMSIVLFVSTNDIEFSKQLYVLTNGTGNQISRTFWREISTCIDIYTEFLFLYFTIYPLIVLTIKAVRSKIYLNRNYSIILLLLLTAIHGFAYITLKINYSGVWFSNTNMSKIPIQDAKTPGFFVVPIAIFLLFFIISLVVAKKKPNGPFKLVSSSQWIEQNVSLADGIGMAFHTHKNSLIALRQHLELIEIYLKKEDQEKIDEHIEISYNVINTQLDSIKKTLKNLQSNRAAARKVDIGECIRQSAKKLSFDGYLEQKLLDGCHVMGDKDALCEVFLNILFNAEYALQDQDDKQIRIKMLKEDEFIQVDIWDNGCGISKENIKHIFTPFFSTKPALHYGGLGLSSVRSTVNAHRGDIRVKSEEGMYTLFQLVLPAYTKGH